MTTPWARRLCLLLTAVMMVVAPATSTSAASALPESLASTPASTSVPASTGTIVGKVRGQGGTLLPGVWVDLYRITTSGWVHHASFGQTSGSASFRFSDLPAGKYRLRTFDSYLVYRTGWVPDPVTITVAKGQTKTVTARLTLARQERRSAYAVNTNSRPAVAKAYREQYLPALRAPVVTSAVPATCAPGATSGKTQTNTKNSINFYRAMAGLGRISFNTTYSARAQQAALMMDANYSLSHNPPSSWRCWSKAGALGASSSNLALGATGPAAIRLYMDDPGANNTAVGHRRWILNPDVRHMGSGNSAGANALWVFDNPDRTLPVQKFSSWPTAGHFPGPLEPGGRWSFTTSRADISLQKAKVSITSYKGSKLTTKAYRPTAVGNTLVFEVSGLKVPTAASDARYRVTISGMTQRGRPLPAHTYSVLLFHPAS